MPEPDSHPSRIGSSHARRALPLNWQRHYRVLADLVDADGHLPDIAPGVLMDGDDIGWWLQQ
ncbi:hypothetical protein [Streptomyces virginiae]|uniref:hypothetical protein n=1 Tax=Streptomyces virginiae TaxID=1961 RepID=UPI003F54023B